MASSDPRAHPGRRRAPEDRRREDARVVVGRCPDNNRRTNGCDGPDIDEAALVLAGAYLSRSAALPLHKSCASLLAVRSHIQARDTKEVRREAEPDRVLEHLHHHCSSCRRKRGEGVCQLLPIGTQVQCEVLANAPAGELHFIMG